jgi:hypothetical protein
LSEGFPGFIETLEVILDMSRQYYSINNLDPCQTHPFGFKLQVSEAMEDWTNSLSIGDPIDVIKSDGFVQNWTRGRIVGIGENRFEVRYDSEKIERSRKYVKKNSFELDKWGTRSGDWDWRENLTVRIFPLP